MRGFPGITCPHCLPEEAVITVSGSAMLDHIESNHYWLIRDIRARGYLICGTCWESTGSYQHRRDCPDA